MASIECFNSHSMIDTDALALAWQAPDDGSGPATDFGTTRRRAGPRYWFWYYQTTSPAPLLDLVLLTTVRAPLVGRVGPRYWCWYYYTTVRAPLLTFVQWTAIQWSGSKLTVMVWWWLINELNSLFLTISSCKRAWQWYMFLKMRLIIDTKRLAYRIIWWV